MHPTTLILDTRPFHCSQFGRQRTIKMYGLLEYYAPRTSSWARLLPLPPPLFLRPSLRPFLLLRPPPPLLRPSVLPRLSSVRLPPLIALSLLSLCAAQQSMLATRLNIVCDVQGGSAAGTAVPAGTCLSAAISALSVSSLLARSGTSPVKYLAMNYARARAREDQKKGTQAGGRSRIDQPQESRAQGPERAHRFPSVARGVRRVFEGSQESDVRGRTDAGSSGRLTKMASSIGCTTACT